MELRATRAYVIDHNALRHCSLEIHLCIPQPTNLLYKDCSGLQLAYLWLPWLARERAEVHPVCSDWSFQARDFHMLPYYILELCAVFVSYLTLVVCFELNEVRLWSSVKTKVLYS